MSISDCIQSLQICGPKLSDSYDVSSSACIQLIGALEHPFSSLMFGSMVIAFFLAAWPSVRLLAKKRTDNFVPLKRYAQSFKAADEANQEILEFGGRESQAKKREAAHLREKECGISGLLCCLGRGYDTDELPEPMMQTQDLGKHADIANVMEAGVAEEDAEIVAKLAEFIGASGIEPMSDPLTLWRFVRARESDLQAAESMYKDTMVWRSRFSIPSIMRAHGTGEEYLSDGSRSCKDHTEWNWKRSTVLPEAVYVQRYGFWGLLDTGDEMPAAIWRMGSADISGYAREDGLVELLGQGFAAHLEDLLQAGRAASLKHRRLIRCRVIVDMHGLSAAVLQHRLLLRKLFSVGKRYFPEVTASITVVRAPTAFAYIYGVCKPFFTPVTRRKVCILGHNFDEGLRKHCGLSRKILPQFLGGEASNSKFCSCEAVPTGLDLCSSLGPARVETIKIACRD